jgi:hypothetical protein
MTVLTTGAPARKADPWNPRGDRGIYVLWLGLFLICVVLGFGLDFPSFLQEKPAPPLIVHIHAAAFTAWLFILSAQVFLVERGNVALHRRLGVYALGFAVLMVILGPAAEVAYETLHLHETGATPQFLALAMSDVVEFAGFITAGYFLRRDAASHKRMMMLAMAALSTAGSGRIIGNLYHMNHVFWPYFFEFFSGPLLIVALMAGWDLYKRGTLNRAFAIGAVLLIACDLGANTLYFSPAWKAAIVTGLDALGYAG